jgi:DNA-binding CsgD family transcriptional regulator
MIEGTRMTPESLADKVVALYQQGRSTMEIGSVVGLNRWMVCKLLHQANVPLRTRNEALSLRWEKKRQDKHQRCTGKVIELYKRGMSLKEIGSLLGLASRTVRKLLCEADVPLRDPSEAISLGQKRSRQSRPAPEPTRQTASTPQQQLQDLRREIERRRKANSEKRTIWNPSQVIKLEQADLLDYVEQQLEEISSGLMR